MLQCFFVLKYVPKLDTASLLHILCKYILDVYLLKDLLGQAGEHTFIRKNIEALIATGSINCKFFRVNSAQE